MDTFEGGMKINLYRVLCPDAHTLGEYHLGLLSASQIDEIRSHLSKCPYCQRELSELAIFMDSLKPELEGESTLGSKLKVIFARLLSPDSGLEATGQANLVFAGTRGDKEIPLIYEAGDWQVVLEVQDDTELPGNKVIIGMVIGGVKQDWQAHLWLGEEKIAVAPIDAAGNFRFEKLDLGSYALILRAPEQEIYIQPLKIY